MRSLLNALDRPVGKQFSFQPLEDITTYELALIIKGSTATTLARPVTVMDEAADDWQTVRRHFTEVEATKAELR